jgi:isoamylase
VVPFKLPDVAEGRHWMGLIDTGQPDSELATHSLGHVYEVTGRSLCAFALATEGALSSDLRYGVGSILEVTERPLD